jgi:hypothetical protein
VEVKIGVLHAPREIVVESEQTSEQVSSAVAAAVKAGGLLSLTDDKGRVVVVPVDKLAYVEIGSPERGRLGFGT